jgi:flagellar motor protein MotB
MEDENNLEFNFWPSFADLMLALVLILVMVLFTARAVITVGTVNLKQVNENQKNVAREIADAYGARLNEFANEMGHYGISIDNPEFYDIQIRNEPALQRITFSEQILFKSGETKLDPKGYKALGIVGQALKKQLKFIKEIQIQGHADNVPTGPNTSNLNLAAFRAIAVFNFFQRDMEIDPAEHLMSITSFGEYKPVQRMENDSEYNQQKLAAHNAGLLKDKNRRIELLLFYRL